MATIYRFIVEQKIRSSGEGRKPRESTGKGSAKKGKFVPLFGGGEKGGVEHNRKMRAINPLLNRMTGGWWEKGMRVGRASMGLIKQNTATGALALSGTAVAILVAFVITLLMKYLRKEQLKAQQLNAQNYNQLENGVGAIHGQYEITSTFWTGRRSYNENK